MTIGFCEDFEKDLELVIKKEVLRRIVEAVADDHAVGADAKAFRAGALDSIGDSLIGRIESKSAAQLVLGLVKYMHQRGHIYYCHEDRTLWEGWGQFEVRLDEAMDNCG